MKKRILSIVLAICLVLTLVPTTVFADGDSHTVTVNAGEHGKVSTDGTSWVDSVSVKVDDGETLDGKVQYMADEGYEFEGVVPKIVSVAAGGFHTVLLDAKGNVWTAGDNNYGQLGRDGDASTFAQVTAFNGIDDISKVKIKAIAAGHNHTVLLDEDGNVWTAGYNKYGQLGRDENKETYNANPTFKQVTVGDGADSVKIKAIAVLYHHTVLLDEDGNVWTAGYNKYGQLGRDENVGTYDANSTFEQVTEGIVITAIAAGDYHTVLLDESKNVWTAGLNDSGQLGRDGDASTFAQVKVGNDADSVKIKAIAAGGYHTVLLDESNNVWTAGDNYTGQLGKDENKGTSNPNQTFKQVTGGISGVKITAIAAGYGHTVLLDEKGNVWTAGLNNKGQLGRTANDNPNPTFTQVTVGDGVKIKSIVAGDKHTVLLDEKGNVWTAGYNKYGQLGREENIGAYTANPTFKQSPVNQDAITFDELINIPIHNNSVFLVKFKVKHTVTVNAGEGGKVSTDGTSWSNSVSVKVDDGETLDGKVQYKADEGYAFDGVVPKIKIKIASAVAGGFHTVLLDEKGNVWTAGLNYDGQLGITGGNTSTFTQVTVGNGVKIKAIAAGSSHTVLLDENGNVWTAGCNNNGQLGRDTSPNSYDQTFTKVTDGISGVSITAIAAGDNHTVLLDEEGNVWTAGCNNNGQLGRDTSPNSYDQTFTKVTDGISGVSITAIAAGGTHTVLLAEYGIVWTAGFNFYGQLGRETNSGIDSTFTKVSEGIGGVTIKAIAAGEQHTVLLDEDGNVWTVGRNYNGQLGRDENSGTDTKNSIFTKVTNGISEVNITAIAAGMYHTVLLDEKGNVWTAGCNDNGQLGRDTSPNSYDQTFTKVTDGISGVKITDIAAGNYHTVLPDKDGNVWTAGNNEFGQLGRDENAGIFTVNSTFKQSPVNPDAITFDEFVNIPIHNNSVFIVKFKDVQKPVITGLENHKTYCDTVEFTVTDNDGIASVTANNVELTATNGKYTLEKGMGTVKVVATDNSGNETSVTVTVNNGHIDTAPKDHICDVCGETFSSHTGGTATYFKKAVCDYCKEEYGDLLTDETAPTGEISIGTNKWNSFLNTITFGIFFKDTQSVTITASDDSYSHNGYTNDKAVKVEYLLSDKGLNKTDLAGKAFTTYNGKFSINPDNKYVVYARLTDFAGNVTYLSSNGVVLDATAPVITGVTDGAVY